MYSAPLCTPFVLIGSAAPASQSLFSRIVTIYLEKTFVKERHVIHSIRWGISASCIRSE